MAVREIVIGDEALLRQVSDPVTDWNEALHHLLDDLTDTMHHYHGIGLAAPQVGLAVRATVIDIGQGVIELINPEILDEDGEQVGVESCLSFPSMALEVKRPAKLLLTAFNRHAERVQIHAEGLLARVLSHEIDHLNGVLFFDRVGEEDMISQMLQQMFGFDDSDLDDDATTEVTEVAEVADLDLSSAGEAGTGEAGVGTSGAGEAGAGEAGAGEAGAGEAGAGEAGAGEAGADSATQGDANLDFGQDTQLSLDMMAEAAWKLQLGVELLRDYESLVFEIDEELEALSELSERVTEQLEALEEKITAVKDGKS